VPALEKRLTIFSVDTFEPVGTIPGTGGNGAAVCPNTDHGLSGGAVRYSAARSGRLRLLAIVLVHVGRST